MDRGRNAVQPLLDEILENQRKGHQGPGVGAEFTSKIQVPELIGQGRPTVLYPKLLSFERVSDSRLPVGGLGMARFDLTDAEWAIIAPLLPGAEGKKNGRPRLDDRKVLNGIFFILRTGSPWRDLPERYGPPVHDRVQPLQPLGQEGHLAFDLRGAFGALAAVAAVDRLVDRARPPTCRRR
ncbi:MAG TPA: transposase [Beijerinckiaceae bacterium]|jgi:hypothetical protein